MYCSSAPDPRRARGAPAVVADVPSGAAVAAASVASALPAVTIAKSRFNAATSIFSNCPDASRARNASVSSASNASSKCPDRIMAAPWSSDASSHACLTSSTISGASDGARPLPVFMRSSARLRSEANRPRSIS